MQSKAERPVNKSIKTGTERNGTENWLPTRVLAMQVNNDHTVFIFFPTVLNNTVLVSSKK